jgi:hypothetical protein
MSHHVERTVGRTTPGETVWEQFGQAEVNDLTDERLAA